MGESRVKRQGKLKKALATVVRLTTSIGQSSSYDLPAGLPPLVNPDADPIRFHSNHGDNIRLDVDRFRAQRVNSFCHGVLFGDRPVVAMERVCLRITELSSRWNGVMRIGFTCHNPAILGHLPKYVCPDLTNKPGFWAKALSERYCGHNAVIHFYVSTSGNVHFGINGRDRGIFFGGVDTRRPLWPLIDLYGNCTGLEMVNQHQNRNNFHSSQRQRQKHQTALLQEGMSSLSFDHQQDPALPSQLPALPAPPDVLPLRHHNGVSFRPMSFHFSTGCNARLAPNDPSVAGRSSDEFAQGYVFTAAPVRLGERLVIQVLATEESYIGSLAFGLTNCDPSLIDTHDLPEDSDRLLDRPEYWVVSKDVAQTPQVGDELSFGLKPDGSVEFSRNASTPSVFMHVDTSLRLWAFWDIYGNTAKIRILGSTTAALPDSRPAPQANQIAGEGSEGTLTNTRHAGESQQECIVCLEKAIDCVLYTCGHMCMCHECALQQWKGRGKGFCPMCREQIWDVIKTFRT